MSQVSATKTERLLNLLIMLLVQRHYVSKERIREILYADAPSTDAFEKTFERDKDELRSLGVPIEVGQMDAYFDDEPGYRIRADQFALPEISLESDEAQVVALATRVWDHARLAEATTDAVGKLTAAGLDLDLERPRDRPAPAECRRAVVRRLLGGDPGPAAGHLRLPAPGLRAAADPTPRALGRRPLLGSLVRRRAGHRPWRGAGVPALAHRRHRHDERRPGRVHRARRAPTFVTWPAGWRPPALPRRPSSWSGPVPAAVLRRTASRVEADVDGPDEQTPWDRLYLSEGAQADELLAFGADLYVESPAALRDEVVAALPGRFARRAHEHGHGRCRQGPGRPPAPPRALPPRTRPGLARRGGAALGVPSAQLEKDLRVLFLCGLPGGYPDDLIDVDLDALEGEGVIRVSNADYLARPLRLTPTEASAIIVALRALRAGSAKETRDVVDRALAQAGGCRRRQYAAGRPGRRRPGHRGPPGPARGGGPRASAGPDHLLRARA